MNGDIAAFGEWNGRTNAYRSTLRTADTVGAGYLEPCQLRHAADADSPTDRWHTDRDADARACCAEYPADCRGEPEYRPDERDEHPGQGNRDASRNTACHGIDGQCLAGGW